MATYLLEFLKFLEFTSDRTCRTLAADETNKSHLSFKFYERKKQTKRVKGPTGAPQVIREPEDTKVTCMTFGVQVLSTEQPYCSTNITTFNKLDWFLDQLDIVRLLPVALSYYLNYGASATDPGILIRSFIYNPNCIQHILPKNTKKSTRSGDTHAIKEDEEVMRFNRIEGDQLVFYEPRIKSQDETKSIIPSGSKSQNTDVVRSLQFVFVIFKLLYASGTYDQNIKALPKIYEKMITATDANVVKRLPFLNIIAGLHVLPFQKHGPQIGKDGKKMGKQKSEDQLKEEFDQALKDLCLLTKIDDSKGSAVYGPLQQEHEKMKSMITVEEVAPVSASPLQGFTGKSWKPTNSGPGLARHRPLVVGEYCECSECSECSSSDDDDDGDGYGDVCAPSGFYSEHYAASAAESESEEELDTLAAHVAAGGRPTQYCECCPSDPLKPGTYFVCDTYPNLAVAVQVAPHGEDGASVLRLARCEGAVAHGVPPVESILSKASSPVEVAFERKVQSLLRDQGAAGVLGGTCQLVFPSDQPPVVWQMHCFSRAVRDAWQGRKEMGPRKAHVARLSALHDPRSGKAFVALVDTRGGGKGGRKYVLKQGLSSHRDVAAATAHFEVRKRGAKGSHAAYALLDDHYRCLQPGAGDAHKARLACVCAAHDDGCRDLSVQECVEHFGGKPLLCANYQMLYAGMRKHADKYGEKASHYVKSLSRSDSQKPVYWDALVLFVEDMQHH